MEKIATCDAGCACAGCTPWHKKCILWRRLANSRLHPLQVAPTWWIGAKFDVYILSTFQWRCGLNVGPSGDTALDAPCRTVCTIQVLQAALSLLRIFSNRSKDWLRIAGLSGPAGCIVLELASRPARTPGQA